MAADWESLMHALRDLGLAIVSEDRLTGRILTQVPRIGADG